MTPETLDRIRADLASAVPWPWAVAGDVEPTGEYAEVISTECGGETVATIVGDGGDADALKTATFIANAPTYVSRLLWWVGELERERDDALAQVARDEEGGR